MNITDPQAAALFQGVYELAEMMGEVVEHLRRQYDSPFDPNRADSLRDRLDSLLTRLDEARH